MKRFRLHGNTAIWDALKVVALNTTTEQNETRSAIPSDMKVSVHVVDNFYRVYDRAVRQILHGEISAEDNAEIISRISAAKRPTFILFHENKVVGWANLHHRHRIKTFKGKLTFVVTMPEHEVKARTEAEAREKFAQIANYAMDGIEGADAEFVGVEITDVVRN